MDKFEYTSDVLSADQLASAFETVFQQCGGWDQIKERLPAGNELGDADALPLTIRPHADGFDPATATVIVSAIVMASPVVQKIALDLWNEIWLPRIRALHGQNAVKPVNPE